MPGCSVCPQMERLFEGMHRGGEISSLQIVDVTEHPNLVKQHGIRSVPFYLINEVAFSGLRTRAEIEALLGQGEAQIWQDKITQQLAAGELDSVEQDIRQHAEARDAMMSLLQNDGTELVVRLGLTAIIEELAQSGVLTGLEQRFIALSDHDDDRIATDALYYLDLLATPLTLQALAQVAMQGRQSLRAEAEELLAEHAE